MMNNSQDLGAEHSHREIPEDIAQYAAENGITFDLWSPVVHTMKKTEKTENDWQHWQEE